MQQAEVCLKPTYPTCVRLEARRGSRQPDVAAAETATPTQTSEPVEGTATPDAPAPRPRRPRQRRSIVVVDQRDLPTQMELVQSSKSD